MSKHKERRHLLGIANDLKEWSTRIIDRARELKGLKLDFSSLEGPLKGVNVALLFFEPSTRTRLSFHWAASNLSAVPASLESVGSSMQKGETLEDTIMTVEAMGAHVIVIRHSENHACERALKVARRAHIINAGDGVNEHPTQALLDAMTIIEKKGSIANQVILVAGDIRHSRVAHSGFRLFKLLGVKKILVTGPKELAMKDYEARSYGVKWVDHFDEALSQADVIYMLRAQRERHGADVAFDPVLYRERYGLTLNRWKKLAKPGAIVMHPGPMNVGVEIDREVADSAQSCVLDQVNNGVFIRMAVMEALHQECQKKL